MTSCLECGGALTFKSERDKTRKKYCSRSCRGKFLGKLRRPFERQLRRECAECKKSFTATSPRHKFCSVKCQTSSACRRYDLRQNTIEAHLRRLAGRSGRSGLTAEHLIQMFHRQHGRCAITGIRMTHGFRSGKVNTHVSLDRVNPGGPYVPGNIQLVCYVVNVMKHTMTMAELRLWCRRIMEGENAIEIARAG